MRQLNGKTAFITGAAHGKRAALGSTFTKFLAAEGANIVLQQI